MLELMILLAIAVAAYMAWNIGANDVANAMGTSVGSAGDIDGDGYVGSGSVVCRQSPGTCIV